MKLVNFFIFILLAALIVAFLYLYTPFNLPFSERQEITANVTGENASAVTGSSKSELQFYDNMRFSKLPISYSIDSSCTIDKGDRMLSAFDFLQNKADVQFVEDEGNIENVDIEVFCEARNVKEQSLFIAGEGGPSEIVNTTEFNVIKKGEIKLYDIPHIGLFFKDSCGYGFDVELHELLHALGFAHSNDKKSIMYNITECDQKLTNEIMDEINRLYSYPSLPDLNIRNITAEKNRNYLNLNIEVFNKGIARAGGVSIIILADEKEIENYDLGEIDYGAGKTFYAQNMRLPLGAKKIEIKLKMSEEDLNDKDNEAVLEI